MLEYITTLLSGLFEGVWLRGVMLGWDQGIRFSYMSFTCTEYLVLLNIVDEKNLSLTSSVQKYCKLKVSVYNIIYIL